VINHVSVGTNDIARSRRFYDPLLELLGFRLLKSDDTGVQCDTSDVLLNLVVPANRRPGVGR